MFRVKQIRQVLELISEVIDVPEYCKKCSVISRGNELNPIRLHTFVAKGWICVHLYIYFRCKGIDNWRHYSDVLNDDLRVFQMICNRFKSLKDHSLIKKMLQRSRQTWSTKSIRVLISIHYYAKNYASFLIFLQI